MTIEVPDSDFGTDVGADVAQQKYQDSVHDFFSMDKEDMDLRPSLSSRNLFTAPRTPRTDDRVSNNTREEIADNNDREAKTKEYIIGKRRPPAPEESDLEEHCARTMEAIIEEVIDQVIDHIQSPTRPRVPKNSWKEHDDHRDSAKNTQDISQDMEERGNFTAEENSTEDDEPNVQTVESTFSPIQVKEETGEFGGEQNDVYGGNQRDGDPGGGTKKGDPLTVEMKSGDDIDQVIESKREDDNRPEITSECIESDEQVDEEIAKKRLCWKCYAIVLDDCPACRNCRADLFIEKCQNCRRPLAKSMNFCPACKQSLPKNVVEGIQQRKLIKSPIARSKFGSFLSLHEVKAEVQQERQVNEHEGTPTALTWEAQNVWGGHQQREMLDQMSANKYGMATIVQSRKTSDKVWEATRQNAADISSDGLHPFNLPKRSSVRFSRKVEGGCKSSRHSRSQGKLSHSTRRDCPSDLGTRFRAAVTQKLHSFSRSGQRDQKDVLMVLTSFGRGSIDGAMRNSGSEFFPSTSRALCAREHMTLYSSSSIYTTDGHHPFVVNSFGELPSKFPLKISLDARITNDSVYMQPVASEPGPSRCKKTEEGFRTQRTISTAPQVAARTKGREPEGKMSDLNSERERVQMGTRLEATRESTVPTGHGRRPSTVPTVESFSLPIPDFDSAVASGASRPSWSSQSARRWEENSRHLIPMARASIEHVASPGDPPTITHPTCAFDNVPTAKVADCAKEDAGVVKKESGSEEAGIQQLFEDFAQITGGCIVLDEAAYLKSLEAANVLWSQPYGDAAAKAANRKFYLRDARRIFKACSHSVCVDPSNDPHVGLRHTRQVRQEMDLSGFYRACAAIKACMLGFSVGETYLRQKKGSEGRVGPSTNPLQTTKVKSRDCQSSRAQRPGWSTVGHSASPERPLWCKQKVMTGLAITKGVSPLARRLKSPRL